MQSVYIVFMATTKKRINITIDIDLLKKLDAAGSSSKEDRSSKIERYCRAGMAQDSSKIFVRMVAPIRQILAFLGSSDFHTFIPHPDSQNLRELVIKNYKKDGSLDQHLMGHPEYFRDDRSLKETGGDNE